MRSSEEMKTSMLPGAITKDEYLNDTRRYGRMTVIAYCTIGSRSGHFAKKMAANGIEIYNLAGGILAWVFDGGRVYRGEKQVKIIHVYGPKWDYAPKGYASVMFGLLERYF